MRAAANSIARGSPSRRAQISATAGALALVTWKSGLTGLGALDEERHGLILRERREGSEGVGGLAAPAQAQETRARLAHAAPPGL